MRSRWYIGIVTVFLLCTGLRVGVFLRTFVPLSTPTHSALLSAKSETYHSRDYIPSFAITSYASPTANNSLSGRYDRRVRPSQNTYPDSRSWRFVALPIIETVANGILHAYILCAETMIVALPPEDISFPFHAFW